MIDKDTIKEKVKVLLNIQDSIQDRVLDILIENISSYLFRLLKRVNPEITEIPEELSFIIMEIVIIRFNRIGSEGMQSEAVEGHSITFNNLGDEFIPYMDIIDDYKKDDDVDGRGKVIFI